ncbi:MAG: mechanosensitive ion channel [Candidatus Latescibacteria bacterium]|jgi:miniconductance mechanosensitive channel|nr:mechanosensitive ion channel [Candidatus Latescibacterota bacterium]
MGNYINDVLIKLGVNSGIVVVLVKVIAGAIIIVLCFVADYITKRLIIRSLTTFVSRTKTTWDDIILKRNVFTRLSHFAPALVIYFLAPFVLEGYDQLTAFITNITYIYMIAIGLLVIISFLDAVLEIYRTFEVSRDIPIKVFIQIIKVAVLFTGGILILSTILNRAPLFLLSGLGAITAVLMLIFKDSILGFVAGIQLISNNMVARDDWIEMPNYGADGDVIDISLTTVKVRNWDKTITTIPTYALITDSFKNWRGMQESGGRRIKRAIYIDMTTIKFCTADMLHRFSKIQYITTYIETKEKEIVEHNATLNIDVSSLVNGRHLTNIGTFRAYVVAYLNNHPMISQNMTFLVRQLKLTENGLPIEIYVFCKDKVWANYEAIQADIFDHILAIIPEFDLKVFQNPSGSDFRGLVRN